MDDIVPGVGGNPTGYLEMTAPNGDIAYVNGHIGAAFVPGPEGKPVLLDNGYWQIVGGTGAFKDLVGAGTLHLKAVSPTDRRFTSMARPSTGTDAIRCGPPDARAASCPARPRA
ncbi:MAG: hypothetical protein JSR21_18170, partial [Proteobacteria bacterium]|nr:hypothetical protein [Pseudomonadota bacterium]